MAVTDMNGVEIVPGQNVLVHQEEEVSTATVIEVFEDNPTKNEPGHWVDVDKGGGPEGKMSYILEVVSPGDPSKKEIEAFQMTEKRRWDNSEWPAWLNAAWQRDPGEGAVWIDPDAPIADGHNSAAELVCGTLEGVYRIGWGDWIVRGVNGELYPYKPTISEAAYEKAHETR